MKKCFTMAQRRGLTPKQRRFVREYPKDCNATQAAIRAGYSMKTAATIGFENLRKPNISRAVQATLQRHLANLDLSLERIVAEAARVGTSDIGELFDETGSLLPMHKLSPDIRRAIASVKVTLTAAGTERVTEVKLWPKLPGLELVAKLLKGLLLDLHLHTGAGGTWEEVLDQMLAKRDRERQEAPAAKLLGEGS